MSADTYLTIESQSEGSYKEKMSKFISFAIPVSSADEAKEHVKAFQKKYFDARHVCWAYMIGAARTEFMSNDNGEPSGTAGRPILGQINSAGLTNIVILVVRYFGGIKLGTSGLITAYKEAAADAIANASIIECHEEAVIDFIFPYLGMNEVMRLVKNYNLTISRQQFDNSCSMSVVVRKDLVSEVRAALSDIDGVSLL